ncbi:MAG: hypothetical protein OXC62_10135 [Aestuariivita sp.]|nr:hypothetical protein [Aestuariivita sp.]
MGGVTDWKLLPQIREYWTLMHFEGVADCMRYELLYRRGGYMACADSICLHPIDGLLSKTCAYTCYTNEFLEGASVVPILACEPGNPFLGELIQRLSKIDPLKLSAPWISTGNLFVARMIRELDPEIVIWPSHYLIPEHYRGEIYKGSDLIYARQLWGTTRGLFKETDGIKGKISVLKMKFIRKRHLRNKKKMAASQK